MKKNLLLFKYKYNTYIMRVINKTHQGRRPYQEDRVCDAIVPGTNYRLIGVFDGHGGHQVADFCAENFPLVIGQGFSCTHEVDVVLKESFHIIDKLVGVGQLRNMPHVGSTAVVALVTPSSVWFANAGDSMGMVMYKCGKVELVSFEHKVENPSEKARIVANGGRITYDDGCARVEQTLNVSRSIGDYHMKRHVISTPYIKSISLNFDQIKYCVLASDGIWDVFNAETLASVIESKQGNIQEALDEAITIATSYGTDNVTLTFFDFN